jgi:hypothetical protein
VAYAKNYSMKKPIPFAFILDYLYPIVPRVNPMFGCYALYSGEKIILIVRERENHPEDNGVWVATQQEFHASLKKELPSLRTIQVLGEKETQWQCIPADSVTFETEVIRACELIKQGDKRIGKIPKKKRKKV